MAVTLNTDQEFVGVTVLWTTSSGGAATVQPGSVAWASSDETQLIVTGNDGNGGPVTVTTVGPSPVDASGNAMTARVSVTADADLGTGVVNVTIVSEDVTVTPGPSSFASGGAIAFPPPSHKV
jgi:hypothetical protein